MALKVRDRVKETTTTTGTGTITLGGAVTGFRTFSSVLSDNDTTYYAIVGDTQFEVGLGTYSSDTLARTTVLSSSNSNSAVSFSTGTKNVFITQPSSKAVFRDASGNIAELTTANLSENTNLYYTDERVDDRISALFQSGTGISFAYNDSSNTFTPTVTLSPFDTDNLSEGSSNLYFTNERVDDRVASLLQNGTGISFTYNDASNTLTPVISLSSFDTDNLSEGSSNLYHTTERVQDIVGAMFSSNTETGITASYEDSDGTIDLVVATQSDNNFTTTLLNKLNAIESNATADQTASEIRTLVESASDSNVFTDADHSKLDGIEASATADQSDSEIKTAYENNSDTNAFTDTLLSKLNGIESGATADQSSEEIQDIVGAMFSSNTETGITATYQDADGTIDLVIGTLNQDTTGNSATATALETARTINGVSFNGTANISFTTDAVSEGSSNLYYTDTRVNSFLTTNNYATQSFVNTAVSNLVDSSPATLDTLNELAAALGDDPNFATTTSTSLGNRLRIDVDTQGLSSTQKTNALTNLGINTQYSGNSATATALATARTIHGVSFDGTANIDLSEVIQDTVGAMFSGNTETNISATYEDSDGTIDLVVATLNQDTTGNSATATALETARSIHGVSFNGTADIDLSEVIQDTVGAMFSSNTETGITASYEDGDGTIDLVVASQTANDFTTTLKNKLDGIETSATADQSDSEIKTAYENNSDTNAFTDALLSKLNGIEASATADQTAEEIQDIVGAMFSSNTETGITATYQDSDGTIDLVVTGSTPTSIADADGDTKIQVEESSDEDKIRFDTGGSERMVIDSSGNVAIGTDSPVTIGGHTGILTLFGSNATALVLKDSTAEKQLRLDDGNLSVRNSSGDTHLMVLDGGNVGLGTDSPSSILNIEGANPVITIGDTSGAGGTVMNSTIAIENGIMAFSTDLGGAVAQGNEGFTFDSHGSEIVRFTGDGNVGIGITSVQTQGALTGNLLEIHEPTFGSGVGGTLVLSSDNTANGRHGGRIVGRARNYVHSSIDFAADTGMANGGRLIFRTLASGSATTDNPTERMRIDSSGRLSVGITSSAGGIATFFGTGTGAEAKVQIEGEGGADPFINFLVNNTTHWSVGVRDSDSDKFMIANHSDLSSGVALTIDASENVMIGTTTASGKLNVDGNLHYGGQLRVNDASHDGSASAPHLCVGFDNDTGFFRPATNTIGITTAGTERMRINSSGGVSIGGTTIFENEALNVKKTGSNDDAVLSLDHDTGDASFYRFIRFYKKNANESLGKIDYDNSGDAMTLAVESDERYKTITGSADGLNLISKLEPIKYTRPDKGVTDGCGFSAQAYKQAFDDIGEYARGLTEGSDTEKWMLDFAPLVPNLVKAIQEQQEQIQTLQNEIELLKAS